MHERIKSEEKIRALKVKREKIRMINIKLYANNHKINSFEMKCDGREMLISPHNHENHLVVYDKSHCLLLIKLIVWSVTM